MTLTTLNKFAMSQVAYLLFSFWSPLPQLRSFWTIWISRTINFFVSWYPQNQENFIYPHFLGFGLLRHLPTKCVYLLKICIFASFQASYNWKLYYQIGGGEDSINLLHILYLLWGITFIHSLLTDDLLVLFVACVVLLFIMSLSISFCY